LLIAGYRLRIWKRELQRLVNEMQLAISVCHVPPVASQWNKISFDDPVADERPSPQIVTDEREQTRPVLFEMLAIKLTRSAGRTSRSGAPLSCPRCNFFSLR
jgi:hypothetical protein